MHLAVACDVVMVADVLPTSLEVVGLALPEAVLLSGACAGAVDDD